MYKKKKYNIEEHLLVANMLTVSYHLREHRLKCHEYSYSPQLKRSLTIAQLADAVSLDDNTISRIELLKVDPKLSFVIKILGYLGYEIQIKKKIK